MLNDDEYDDDEEYEDDEEYDDEEEDDDEYDDVPSKKPLIIVGVLGLAALVCIGLAVLLLNGDKKDGDATADGTPSEDASPAAGADELDPLAGLDLGGADILDGLDLGLDIEPEVDGGADSGGGDGDGGASTASASDNSASDNSASDSLASDSSASGSRSSDSSASDSSASDSSASDSRSSDSRSSDSRASDSRSSDSSASDSRSSDSRSSDSRSSDSSASDSRSSDSSASDSSASDSRSSDSSASDSSASDSSSSSNDAASSSEPDPTPEPAEPDPTPEETEPDPTPEETEPDPTPEETEPDPTPEETAEADATPEETAEADPTPEPTPEEPAVPMSYEREYLASIAGKANSASLSAAELNHLKAAPVNDPLYLTAMAIGMAHHESKRDYKSHCEWAKAVTDQGRYKYKPEFTLELAKCHLRNGAFDSAIRQSETTISYQTDMGAANRGVRVTLAYQIKAKARTAVYEADAKKNAGFGNEQMLNKAVAAWTEVRNYAKGVGLSKAIEQANREIEDLDQRRAPTD